MASQAMTSLEMMRRVSADTLQGETADLTARQFALLLAIFMRPGPHAVRDLSKTLDLPKPAVTRALDVLERQGFVRRKRDRADRARRLRPSHCQRRRLPVRLRRTRRRPRRGNTRMSDLDPRLTPARPDLAAAHLKGHVEAERFVEPVDRQAVVAAAPIRRSPDPAGAMDDQVLAGEVFAVLEERSGWGWGFSRAGGYVGWVDLSGFGDTVRTPDRRIAVLRTYAFSRPDIKSAPNHLLSLNALISAGRREGRFVEAEGLGWVVEAHTDTLETHAGDFVAVAEGFLGAPYLWGGKESLGLDCSGLLQMALRAAGLEVPRDADQQEAALKDIWPDVTGIADRERGDVVFWPGHVGIMTDSEHLLHANAGFMEVTLEPFVEAEARIREQENPVRTIVRRV